MKRLSLTILILLIVFSLQPVFAQGPPPPDGGGVDDVLPINFLVFPLLLIGIILGYVITKKSSN